MMMRIDKVTRKMSFGFKKVYSLVLDEEGLYVIRTGNVGALQHYETGDLITSLAARGIGNAYVKQLEEGEARLEETPLEQLAGEKGNAFIPLAEIRSVKTKRGEEPEMKLRTDQGDFRFVFTHTPAEQVAALEQSFERGA